VGRNDAIQHVQAIIKETKRDRMNVETGCKTWTRSPLPVQRHIEEMWPHEQCDRPPPPGGESEGGIKKNELY
jgi:hypothetical protein